MKYQGACLVVLILRVSTLPARDDKAYQARQLLTDNEDERDKDQITLLISRGKRKGRTWNTKEPNIKMIVKNHDDNYAKEYYDDIDTLPKSDSLYMHRNQPNGLHRTSVRQPQHDETGSENIADFNTTSAQLSAGPKVNLKYPLPELESTETSNGLGQKMVIEIPLSVKNSTSNHKADTSNRPQKHVSEPNYPHFGSFYNPVQPPPYIYEQPAYNPYQPAYNPYTQPPYKPYQPPKNDQYQPPPYNPFQEQPYNPYQLPPNNHHQPPINYPYQPPTNNQYQPPINNPYQPLTHDQYQPLTKDQYQPLTNDQYQPPTNNQLPLYNPYEPAVYHPY